MRGGYRAIGDQSAPKKEEEEERRKEGPFIPKSGFLRLLRPKRRAMEKWAGAGGGLVGEQNVHIERDNKKNFIVDPHELGTRVARYE